MNAPAARTRVRVPTALAEWESALAFYGGRRKGNSINSACPLCGGTDRFHVKQKPGRVLGGCRHCINEQPDGRKRWLEVCRLLFGEDEEAFEYRRTRRREPAPPPDPRDAPPDPAVVAKRAADMLRRAKLETHPYLAAKGFPEQRMMVLDEQLLVPLRPIEDYRQLASLQLIRPDGAKKYLYGGRAAKCVYHLGRGGERWWCEGLATALSVQAALLSVHRRARVTVCFSASTLAQVARGGFVVTDHDWWRCRNGHRWDDPGTCPECGLPGTKPAGLKAAEAAGRPWWQPPAPGTDANDHHMRYGLDDLAKNLLRLIWQERDRGS